METSPSMATGEGEEKKENSSPISEQKLSPKKELPVITLEDRLAILQQSIHDFQQQGGEIEILDLHGKLAVVLHGITQDLHGNLVVIHD